METFGNLLVPIPASKMQGSVRKNRARNNPLHGLNETGVSPDEQLNGVYPAIKERIRTVLISRRRTDEIARGEVGAK